MNNVCNLNCDYCIDRIGGGRTNEKIINDQIPDDKLIRSFRNLLSFGFESYKFKIYGGETTLYPDLPRFLDLLFSEFVGRCTTLKFSTNGLARDIDYFRNFFHYPRDSFLFQLTIHLEYFEPGCQIEKIIDLFLKNNVNVQVNILFDTRRRELLNYVLNKYKPYSKLSNCQVIPFILYSDSPSEKFLLDYTPAEIEEFQNLIKELNPVDPFRHKIDDFNRLKDNKNPQGEFKNQKFCVSGQRGIIINSEGKMVPPCSKVIYKDNEPIWDLSENDFRRQATIITKCEKISRCQKSTATYL